MSQSSLRGRNSRRRSKKAQLVGSYSRALRFEPLEDRRLLSITVDTLVDEDDGISVGGISLRDAIAGAAPGETIDFASSLTSSGPATITLMHGQILINKSLTISGPGADSLIIDVSNSEPVSEDDDGEGGGNRIFEIDDGDGTPNADVTISGLTLTGGDLDGDGGAIYSQENLSLIDTTVSENACSGYGGGIYSSGPLTITHSTISENSAGLAGGAIQANLEVSIADSMISHNEAVDGLGGGIQSRGPLTIHRSAISDNFASWGGGGISADSEISVAHTVISQNRTDSLGGGIYSWQQATIVSCTISGNFAAMQGGGISAQSELTVTDSIVSYNQSCLEWNRDGGGGIYWARGWNSDHASVHITRTTVSNNTTGTSGGGIWISSMHDDETVEITESTIAGNTARGMGGGILAYHSVGTIVISNTTVSNNTANEGGGLYFWCGDSVCDYLTNVTITENRGQGGLAMTGVCVSLVNSIVSGNTDAYGVPYDVRGTFNPASFYNLVGSHGTGGLTERLGNILGVDDPRLGPLQDNGGPTWTHMPEADSPAINAGRPSYVYAEGEFDQRGEVRVLDGRIDIGAVETAGAIVDPPPPSEDGFVDIVLVVDESSSMGGSGEPLNLMCDFYETLVAAMPSGSIQYGLVGFGESGSGAYAHTHLVGEGLLGTIDELGAAYCGGIVSSGDTEDGWDGIDHALTEYTFRPGAAVNMLLFGNDAQRWNLNNTLTQAGITAALDSRNAVLYAAVVLTVEEYTDVAWSTGGAAWSYDSFSDPSSQEALAKAMVSRIASQFATGNVFHALTSVTAIDYGADGSTVGAGFSADPLGAGISTTAAIDLNSNSIPDDIAPDALPDIFQNAREAANGQPINLAFGLANGMYTVELYFAEIESVSTGARVFDVLLEGTKVLQSYDIANDWTKIEDIATDTDGLLEVLPAGSNTATVKTFEIVVTDGELNIDLNDVGGAQGPLLSALRILNEAEPPSTQLAGDYNDDGIVDVRDYTRWRNSYSWVDDPNNPNDQPLPLMNETADIGVFSEADFEVWKAHFGERLASGLAGDYNDDGIVDVRDYTRWRNSYSWVDDPNDPDDQPLPLMNETADIGVFSEADFEVWKAHFGEAAPGQGAAAAVTSASNTASLVESVADSAVVESIASDGGPELTDADASVGNGLRAIPQSLVDDLLIPGNLSKSSAYARNATEGVPYSRHVAHAVGQYHPHRPFLLDRREQWEQHKPDWTDGPDDQEPSEMCFDLVFEHIGSRRMEHLKFGLAANR